MAGCLFVLFVFVLQMHKTLQINAEYNFDVFSVNKCPLCKEDWELRSTHRKCNSTHGYHCVPNKHRTSLIEFCYPRGVKIPFEAGNCLELAAKGILNQVSCSTAFSSGCPDKFFFSNDIYKFPKCLAIDTTLRCFVEDLECICPRWYEHKANEQNITSTERINVDRARDQNENTFPGKTTYISVIVGLAALIILTLVVVPVVVILRRWKKARRSGHQVDVSLYIRNNEERLLLDTGEKEESDVKTNTPFHQKFSKLRNRGFSPLHLAAKEGNIVNFEEIWKGFPAVYEKESGIDSRTRDGRNCFHVAAYYGHCDICSHILRECKALFSSKDNNKMNPAHWAALGGKTEILRLMLKSGCDLADKTDKYDENIVLFACIGNWIDVCKFVESNKAISFLLHSKNRENWNAIQYAAKRGYFEIFRYLFEDIGVDCTNKSAKTNKNCLHTACEMGQTKICKYILSKMPELLNECDNHEYHAGHFVAKSGNLDILLELKRHTDLYFFKKATSHNINILHVACKYASLSICEQLKEWNIHCDLCQEITEKGWNAALFITERSVDEERRIKILELLVQDNCLDVYHVSRAGKTILYNACVNQSKKMVKYLLHHYPELAGIERALDPRNATKSDEINAIFEEFEKKEMGKGSFFSRF